MSLSDSKVRNAKPREKQFKLSDTAGMYLFVTPNGGKCWRLKYRFHGKEKLLALGTFSGELKNDFSKFGKTPRSVKVLFGLGHGFTPRPCPPFTSNESVLTCKPRHDN
jgi:hypothetical protein